MAHLNLRDHRIEAKIAYVGPEAHILSTFARLRNEPAFSLIDDRILDWRPATKRFRDCDVFVKLVVGDREGADAVVTVSERTTTDVAEEIATLETTLGAVMASLEAAPAAATADADGAHPLLDALRGVLRDTVREHVDDLASRLDVAAQMAQQIHQVREDIRCAADSVDAVMLRIQRFDAFMKRLEKVEESTNALNQRLSELIEELKKPKKSWFT